jgi:hypothetical protein
MSASWAIIRRRVVDAARRYLNTWSLLLRDPAGFMRCSLEEKAKCCTSPWSFFVASLIAVPAILAPVSSIGFHFIDPYSELNTHIAQGDVGGSNPYWCGVNLAFVAALWYVVFVKVLKMKSNIRTSAPGRRIFYEILYMYSGPSQLFCLASMAGGLVFLGGVVTFVTSPHFSPPRNDLLAAAIAVLIVVTWLTLTVILPILIIPLRYDVLIATTLFSISSARAYLICGIISVFAFSALLAAHIQSSVLLPRELTKSEREAVEELFSLARLESRLYSGSHSSLALDGLIEGLSAIDPTEGDVQEALGASAIADIRNIQRVDAGHSRQYVFTAYSGKRFSYVEAVPREYGSNTKHSFLIFCSSDPDAVLTGFGGDHRGGRAELSDPRLLPPLIMHYR